MMWVTQVTAPLHCTSLTAPHDAITSVDHSKGNFCMSGQHVSASGVVHMWISLHAALHWEALMSVDIQLSKMQGPVQ